MVPVPGETVELLRERAWPTVLGNADAFLLDERTAEGAETITERQLEIRSWSLAQLSDDQRAFVASFSPTIEATSAGMHPPRLPWQPELVPRLHLPDNAEHELRSLVGPVDATIVAGGHTHQQFVRRLPDALFVNPGSVGLSYDHEHPEGALRADPWAAYAVVTVDAGRFAVELRRIRSTSPPSPT